MDNIVGFELVLPNGTVINVTADAPDPDLFFSLKVSTRDNSRCATINGVIQGGYNNFVSIAL